MSRLAALPLLALLLASAPARAFQDPFLFSITERGVLSLDGTVLETLPGKFDPADEQEPTGQHRWTAFGVVGPDRYSLRLDGLMQLNGAKYERLPFTLLTQNTPFWLALDVSADGVFALRTDGLIARDGEADDDMSPQGNTFFFDLAAVGEEVYTLRFDGAVFVDAGDTPAFQLRGSLDPDPKDPDVDAPTNDGSSPDTAWIRLVRDPVDDTLLALRADGVVFRLDPADAAGLQGEGDDVPPAGEEVARFPLPSSPVPAQLYVDLEVDADGALAVLRANGEVYTLDDEEEPLVDYPPMNLDEDDDFFVDLALFDGGIWAVRWNGFVFRDTSTDVFVDLAKKRYVALALSDETPNLDNFDDRKPVTARYKTRVTEGEDVSIPVLVTDLDEPSGAGITISAEDLKKTPEGLVFDEKTGRLEWPNAGPKGSYAIRVIVQEDDVAKPRKMKFALKVLAPDEKPKNKPPIGTKVRKLQALVGVELVVPVITTDRDGDEVTVEPFNDEKGVFALGAIYDPDARELRWTPTFDHVGKHSAVLRLSDGTKNKKLKFKISVVNPLPIGLE